MKTTDLLKLDVKWNGNDLEDCLDDVYKNRLDIKVNDNENKEK